MTYSRKNLASVYRDLLRPSALLSQSLVIGLALAFVTCQGEFPETVKLQDGQFAATPPVPGSSWPAPDKLITACGGKTQTRENYDVVYGENKPGHYGGTKAEPTVPWFGDPSCSYRVTVYKKTPLDVNICCSLKHEEKHVDQLNNVCDWCRDNIYNNVAHHLSGTPRFTRCLWCIQTYCLNWIEAEAHQAQLAEEDWCNTAPAGTGSSAPPDPWEIRRSGKAACEQLTEERPAETWSDYCGNWRPTCSDYFKPHCPLFG